MAVTRSLATLGVGVALASTLSAATALTVHRSAPAVSASYPVCETVSTSGTLVGTHKVGPICPISSSDVLCEQLTTGLSPEAEVTVDACLPNSKL